MTVVRPKKSINMPRRQYCTTQAQQVGDVGAFHFCPRRNQTRLLHSRTPSDPAVCDGGEDAVDLGLLVSFEQQREKIPAVLGMHRSMLPRDKTSSGAITLPTTQPWLHHAAHVQQGTIMQQPTAVWQGPDVPSRSLGGGVESGLCFSPRAPGHRDRRLLNRRNWNHARRRWKQTRGLREQKCPTRMAPQTWLDLGRALT